MSAFSVVRLAHIAVGFTALTAFWIPLVAPKGGHAHRVSGWVFAVAMWLASAFALTLCALRLTDDETSNDAQAVFLAFVGLLAANGASTGVRVVKTKARTGAHRNAFDLGFSALLVASSLGLAAFGLSKGSALFAAFSALGLFLGIAQLRFWLHEPATKREWWFKHMSNMLAACIATVTAFLVVNVSRLGLESYSLFVWVAPGVIGGLGIRRWVRHYRRKFQGA